MTRRRPLSPLRLVAAAVLGLLATACARPSPPVLLINESGSLPRGVYRLTHGAPSKGAVVAVRPTPAARRYLERLGAGPGARLLKRVAATEGETVCRVGDWMTWPSGAARALPRDRRGRALPTWNGCRRLQAGELLLLGDTSLSFDSRYVGPVSARDVEGTYAEAWRW